MSLEDALINATTPAVHSDGQLAALAKHVQALPIDLLDQAFSRALLNVLEKFSGTSTTLEDLLIAAEQFAYQAGTDRFSVKSGHLVNTLLAPAGLLSYGSELSAVDTATCRARAFALARSIGVTVTLKSLDEESRLYDLQPLLWLDLVQNYLASNVFVERIKALLDRDAFHPVALIPRLKLITQHHGQDVAQAVLDIACRRLYSRSQYSEAEDLIARANTVEPRGWRLAGSSDP